MGGRKQSGRWLGVLGMALAALTPAGDAVAQAGSRAAGRVAGPAPGGDLELVDRFDADGDGRLGAAERAAARTWLETYRGGSSVGGRGAAAFAPTSPGPRVSPADVRPAPDVPLYDTSVLRTIFVDFGFRGWEAELAAFYDTDVELPATVTIDGRSYPDVGVHFRGASTFRGVPTGSKRSLNLSFDWVHDGQNVGRYRTLNLLNGFGDPTFVRTVLYSEIAGRWVPTPKTSFVRVVIEGESWGVYVSQQQFNKDLLRDLFGETEGDRWSVSGTLSGRAGLAYLGEDPDAYRPWYDVRSGDDEASWRALIELTRVLGRTPPERLEAALAPLLDVDEALRFLAVDVVLANHDGYWIRGSDYDLYRAEDGRFHLIPRDFNEALGAMSLGAAGGPDLDPLVALDDPTKPLRSRLLAVPELRERYLRHVREIAETSLDWRVLGPRVAAHRALIEEEARLDTRKLYSMDAFAEGFEALRRWVEARREYLLAER